MFCLLLFRIYWDIQHLGATSCWLSSRHLLFNGFLSINCWWSCYYEISSNRHWWKILQSWFFHVNMNLCLSLLYYPSWCYCKYNFKVSDRLWNICGQSHSPFCIVCWFCYYLVKLLITSCAIFYSFEEDQIYIPSYCYFVPCAIPFSFKHVLFMTNDSNQFRVSATLSTSTSREGTIRPHLTVHTHSGWNCR